MDKNKAIKEVWKDIHGYEGIYQVSNTGKVKKLYREWFGRNGGLRTSEERIFTPHYSKFGYNHHCLIKAGKTKDVRVCRLVALAFIPNPENKPFVNHKDGNKANDHVDNLEWNTHSENDLHAFRIGLRKSPRGSLNGASKVTEEIVIKIRKEYKGGRYVDLAKKYGLCPNHIGQIIRKNTWKHI